MSPSHKVVVKTSRNNAGEELQTMPSPREPHEASGHLSQEPVSAPCSVWAESPYPQGGVAFIHVSHQQHGSAHLKPHGRVTAPPSSCSLPLSLPLPLTPANTLLFLKLPHPSLCISCPTAQCSSRMSTGLTSPRPAVLREATVKARGSWACIAHTPAGR